MFNNQSGASAPLNQRPNVNSSLQSFFGPKMMFTVSLWNDKVSLSWTPAIGQDANGTTRYDRDHRINTALSSVKVGTIVKAYEKHLKKYVDREEELPEGVMKSIGVKIGGNKNTGALPSIFSIGVGRHEGSETPVVAIMIAKNVTDMGTTPENVTIYECNDTPILVDYDPTAGGDTIEEHLCGEIDVFINILKHHIDSYGIIEHARRYNAALFPNSRNNQGGSQQLPDNPANMGFPANGETEFEFPFNG